MHQKKKQDSFLPEKYHHPEIVTKKVAMLPNPKSQKANS